MSGKLQPRSPAPSRQALALTKDCLQPIADGLRRITAQCWNVLYHQGTDSPAEENFPPYLRTDCFRRHPEHIIEWLYREHHLEAALTFLQVHESVALAHEVERRLRVPLHDLCKLEFRAYQILAYDWNGSSETAVFHPYPFDELQLRLHHYFNDEKGTFFRKIIEEVLERWDELRNTFFDTSRYLCLLISTLKSKHGVLLSGSAAQTAQQRAGQETATVPTASGLSVKAEPQADGGGVETLPFQSQTSTPTILYLGEKAYLIGNSSPITVTDSEHAILQEFIAVPSMDTELLQTKSGNDRAPRILGKLATKYSGAFAPAIRLPGGKSKGGYHVSIQDARPQRA